MKLAASLLASLFLSACGTPHDSVRPAPAETPPPPSVLAGLVRALETVRAVRPAGTTTQVRALECDTRFDRGHRSELERLFLDVTVFAPTNLEAQNAFVELRQALEDEAGKTERVEPASRERVIGALAELDRQPAREDLVSYSDRIRLEVHPGQGKAAPLVASGPVELGVDSITNYVYERASRPDAVGTVRVRPASTRAGSELNLLLRPEFDFQRFDLARIGTFLASLENDSPAVRLTHLRIERSQHEPDPKNPRGWTFEAELAARAAAPVEASAAVASTPESTR